MTIQRGIMQQRLFQRGDNLEGMMQKPFLFKKRRFINKTA